MCEEHSQQRILKPDTDKLFAVLSSSFSISSGLEICNLDPLACVRKIAVTQTYKLHLLQIAASDSVEDRNCWVVAFSQRTRPGWFLTAS